MYKEQTVSGIGEAQDSPYFSLEKKRLESIGTSVYHRFCLHSAMIRVNQNLLH